MNEEQCLHFKLRNTINGYSCETCDKVFNVMLTSDEYSLLLAAHNDLDVLTDKLQQENTQLKDLVERLKQEAQAHAMEADTQKGIVLGVYQALGIQKGDWNGKRPVVEIVEQLKADLSELKRKNALLRQRPDLPVDRLPAIESYEQEIGKLKARIERLEDIVRLARSSHNIILTSNPPKDAWIYNNVDSKISSILNESEQQSLVELQADAVQLMLDKAPINMFYDAGYVNDMWIEDYVNQLRNSVKDGE